MKLQDRDIEIINYIKKYGATIMQIADLFFNSSYDSARKRLKKLKDNRYINSAIHPSIGKKVYYKKRIPSYHSLVIQQIYILNKKNIEVIKREVKISSYRVDALIITKNNKVVILEVELFNKTKKEKILAIKKYIKTKLQQDPKFLIVNKNNINNKKETTI